MAEYEILDLQEQIRKSIEHIASINSEEDKQRNINILINFLEEYADVICNKKLKNQEEYYLAHLKSREKYEADLKQYYMEAASLELLNFNKQYSNVVNKYNQLIELRETEEHELEMNLRFEIGRRINGMNAIDIDHGKLDNFIRNYLEERKDRTQLRMTNEEDEKLEEILMGVENIELSGANEELDEFIDSVLN